jgi:hypothetical protein
MEELLFSVVPFNRDPDSPSEGGSVTSSLTGHGYDQKLGRTRTALNDLRPNWWRAVLKAARAVKAEHAIQSAEKNTVKIGKIQSTQGAEAATGAKRSAEAMAKQRC